MIHFCGYASQPDIQIYYNNDMTIPKWGTCIAGKADTGVYEGEKDYLYTFEEKYVTCKECLIKQRKAKQISENDVKPGLLVHVKSLSSNEIIDKFIIVSNNGNGICLVRWKDVEQYRWLTYILYRGEKV